MIDIGTVACASVLALSVAAGTAVGHGSAPCPQGTSAGVECVEHEDHLVITGTSGPDAIVGSNGGDEIEGGGGNDRISGRGGADEIVGARGNDVIAGSSGNDNLNGGSGRDRLWGGRGNDVLVGGPGRDWFSCGSEVDTVSSSPGEQVPRTCEAER